RPYQVFRDKEFLKKEYLDKGRTEDDIAKEFSVTSNAISYWIRKHGIPTRPTSETRKGKPGARGEKARWFGCKGVDAPNWKGGCTPERQSFYSSQEWKTACYQTWKKQGAQCVRCGNSSTPHKLHIHHILSFAVKTYRARLNNLILLCQ